MSSGNIPDERAVVLNWFNHFVRSGEILDWDVLRKALLVYLRLQGMNINVHSNQSERLASKSRDNRTGAVIQIWSMAKYLSFLNWLDPYLDAADSKMLTGFSLLQRRALAIDFVADITGFVLRTVTEEKFSDTLEQIQKGKVLPKEFICSALEFLESQR